MIEFRPLAESDLPLLRDWLGRAHVARWWPDPVDELLDECRAAIEGRDPSDHYLIVAGGRPVGMVQMYLAAEYPEWEEEIGGLGPGAAGVDLLIGQPEDVGRGLGARVLAEFVHAVVFADARVSAAVATVEEANRRSWRAFEKAGFRHVRNVFEDGLPHRLMRLER